MFITDPVRGSTTTISRRLYSQLRTYADAIDAPFDSIVRQLRNEIHQS